MTISWRILAFSVDSHWLFVVLVLFYIDMDASWSVGLVSLKISFFDYEFGAKVQ